MNMKKLFKKHWDIILLYLGLGLDFFYAFVIGKNTCSDWGCLGVAIIFILALIIISFTFGLIGIVRNIKNKELRKSVWRWILIIIPFLPSLYWLITTIVPRVIIPRL